MFLRPPEYCKIHDFHTKSRNQADFIIYNIFTIFAEIDEFMEIQSGDSEKLQKYMKRHWFYKAWRMRAAPDQKNHNFAKNPENFQCLPWRPRVCSEKCRFRRK